jgi:hypothetical protein
MLLEEQLKKDQYAYLIKDQLKKNIPQSICEFIGIA